MWKGKKPKPAVPVSAGEREVAADMAKMPENEEGTGVYRGLTAGEYSRMPVGRKSRRKTRVCSHSSAGAVVCVLGVTAYLNHEKDGGYGTDACADEGNPVCDRSADGGHGDGRDGADAVCGGRER